jgi:hypothetical protein
LRSLTEVKFEGLSDDVGLMLLERERGGEQGRCKMSMSTWQLAVSRGHAVKTRNCKNSVVGFTSTPKCPKSPLPLPRHPRLSYSFHHPLTGSIFFLRSQQHLLPLFLNPHLKSLLCSTAPPLYMRLNSPPSPLYQTRRAALRRIELSCATSFPEAH